jgi:Tetratricopeptide repeat.
MICLIIIFVCCSCFQNAFSSERFSTVDSLNEVISAQSGRDKIMSMIALTKSFSDISLDESIEAGEAAIKEANAFGFKDLEAKAYDALGRILVDAYELDLAHDYLEHSLELYRQIDDSTHVLDVLRDIGYAELVMGDVKRSIRSFGDALSLAELIKNQNALADIQNNLAVIYFQMGDSDNALRYFIKARQTYEGLCDTLSVAQCTNNIGAIYFDWKKTEEAIDLFYSIMPTLERYGDLASLVCVNRNLGLIYENDIIKYDTALMFFTKSMELSKQIGDSVSIADNMIGIANVNAALHNTALAFEGYNEAFALSQRISHVNGQLAVYAHRGIVYSQLGQWEKSLENIEMCLSMEKESGIDIYDTLLKRFLIIDYLRLGRHDEMQSQIDTILSQNKEYRSKIHDLVVKLDHADFNSNELIWRIENLEMKIEEKDATINRYRLLFYCVTSIILIVTLLIVINVIKYWKRI